MITKHPILIYSSIITTRFSSTNAYTHTHTHRHTHIHTYIHIGIHTYPTSNPAVTSQPAKVFVFVAQALEAETLQGQTATRVVEATKTLLAAASLNPAQLLAQLSPETQAIVHAWFA